MADLTLYVKPTCTTCRKSVELLRREKVDFETIDFFKSRLTAAALKGLCRKLGVSPREILRTKDPAYEALGLASGRHTDAELLELMVSHPGLIQRPIAVKGGRAVVGRPPESIVELLR